MVDGREEDPEEDAELSIDTPEVNTVAADVKEEVSPAAPEVAANEVERESGAERTELAEVGPEIEARIEETAPASAAEPEPIEMAATPEPEPEEAVEPVAAGEPVVLGESEQADAVLIEISEEAEAEPETREELVEAPGEDAVAVETPVEMAAELVAEPVVDEESILAEAAVPELDVPSVELKEPAVEEPPEETEEVEETAAEVEVVPEEAAPEVVALEAEQGDDGVTEQDEEQDGEQDEAENEGQGRDREGDPGEEQEEGQGENHIEDKGEDQGEEPGNETMEMNEPIPEQEAEPTTVSETALDGEVESEAATVPAAEETVPAAVAEVVPATEIEAAKADGVAEAAAVPAEDEPAAKTEATTAAAHKPFIKLETRDNEADLSPFSVVVLEVYDGPLDLLLDLIRKQDIDIYDIPIARITAQFLAYVNQLKATDVDVAGEFIYTASLLIHIKSKMLLPRAPTGPDDAAEDPRRELVERLLEHERFKNAAQMLQQKQMLEAASWTNPGIREFKDDEAAEPEIAADTVDLVRVFRDILERARNRPVINVEEDSVTVGQMIQFLARRLTMEDKPVALRRLLSHTKSERALIAMFLALLELVRLQAILLRQDLAFSEIFIKKHTGFESVMNEGLDRARDDWK